MSRLFQIVLFPEELVLGSGFINWANRIPQKSLSLIIIARTRIVYEVDDKVVKKESMEVIEKFKKLGVIKKFEIVTFYDSFC